LPQPEEVAAVEELLSSLVQRGAAAETENRRLAKLRDAMLPHLLSNELRVQDAEKMVGEAM
jgi:type I restriction enzyme S subunit